MEVTVRPTPENNPRELTPSRHQAADRTHNFPVTQTLAEGTLTTPYAEFQAYTAPNARRLTEWRTNYCGAGNLSGLQPSPASSTTASIHRNLMDEIAARDDADNEQVAEGSNGGEVDGDETCIAVWEHAIIYTTVGLDARTSVGEDCGTYLDPITVPDRSPLPAENISNFPQESHRHGIRARKVNLQELFPVRHPT
ncbi:hypothetical protein GN244_ATG02318 [Phytophthora infestans]|uniref:Uncharacterized protein n=1 Tax=Phytophthora infestans TaxID=4787 RepID=A0A833W776_PHYIN|nr:hypothetical protein GN244_ATG02318 [Phytophthora infestans]KAF4130370.1 hypothetical protein GN958_ATG20435 [Phytophthora infestans]